MQNHSTLPIPLKRLLQKTRRRLRQRTIARLFPPALTIGLLATLLLIGYGWLYPLTHPLWLLAAGLSLTGIGLGALFFYALARPYDPPALGRLLDRRLHLDERVSTALDLAADSRRTPAPIIQAQLADTLRHLSAVDLSLALPIHLSWRWLVASNILIIAIAAGLLLPNPQLRVLQQRAKEKQLLAQQKERLEEIRVDLLNNEALPEAPETEAALQTLESLIEALEAETLSPEETLAELSEAEQELAALQEALGQETGLNDLAQRFGQFQSTTDLAEALRQRDFKGAAEFLNSVAGNPAASPDDRQDMADALRQAAQQTGNEELAAALSEAAEALDQAAQSQAAQGTASQSETQAAQEALQQAAEALTEAGQANQEALEQALGNIQEAREQLAQADGQGENQGEQSGQGQGQEQGQEQGQGQGAAPFDGPGQGAGSGRGDSDAGAADLFADRPGGDLETDGSPNQGRSDEYQADYPPIHWGGEGGPLVNPDRQGAEEGLPIGEAPVNPNQPPDPALTPYNQVYGQYADAAGEALDDSYIPLGMKEYVRNYFGALEPE